MHKNRRRPDLSLVGPLAAAVHRSHRRRCSLATSSSSLARPMPESCICLRFGRPHCPRQAARCASAISSRTAKGTWLKETSLMPPLRTGFHGKIGKQAVLPRCPSRGRRRPATTRRWREGSRESGRLRHWQQRFWGRFRFGHGQVPPGFKRVVFGASTGSLPDSVGGERAHRPRTSRSATTPRGLSRKNLDPPQAGRARPIRHWCPCNRARHHRTPGVIARG